MKTHILLGLLSVSTVFAHSPPSSPWHRRKRHTKHFARTLPSGWNSAGCVSDADPRALTGYMYSSDNQMTPANCIAACDSRGFTFSGVENGNECHCGNSLENGQGVAKPASDCNAKCSGSPDQTCGGSWRLSLFQKLDSTDPEGEWKTIQSCAADPIDGRLMTWMTTLNDNTPAKCQATCSEHDYKFAGVEYGKECWCTNALAATPKAAPDSECQVQCAGDSTETCGGGYHMTVYENTNSGTPPPPSKWTTKLACGLESAESRALVWATELPNNTPEVCQATCQGKGYVLAGVEYGKECWCGDSIISTPKTVPTDECNVPCAGDSKLTCGGSYRIQLYQYGEGDGTPTPEPEPTIPDGWTYSACMVDDWDRILPDQQAGGALNTPASCIATCAKSGFSIASVENGHECFCGKSFARSPALAPESECNIPCAGDLSTKCGGAFRANVYVKLAPDSGVLSKLLPVRKSLEWWTTSYESDNAIVLSDESLRAFKITKNLTRNYGEFEGKQTMKAHYPKGSRNPGNQPQGGLSFYAPGPANFDLTKAKEATFGFSVYFPAGFNAVLGGKLFGLYGGNSDDESVSCSGGSRSSACFSARMMWREELAGEFYTYMPPYDDPRFAPNAALCNLPGADCNPTYGISIGRGSFYFTPGQWYAISQRVKLNTAGQADGELELFADGVSVIKVGGLILRDGALGRIRGVMYQTFFGGSKPEYETPIDQDVYFGDLTCAITEYYNEA